MLAIATDTSTRPTSDQLRRRMERLCVIENGATAQRFAPIVAFDRAELWRESGARDMEDWMSVRYGMSRTLARKEVCIAHALEERPFISDAFRRGLLSLDKVELLCEFVPPEQDEEWAKKAQCLNTTASAVASIEGGVAIEVAGGRPTIERGAPPGRRQRYQVAPEVRIAIENHAMEIATRYYENTGWTVEDVSRRESFDLLCSTGRESRHVEVKGTQSAGEAILLTPNEVSHAEQTGECALFIVADVVVDNSVDPPLVSGGRSIIFDPWEISDGVLKPIGLEYWPGGSSITAD
jgi:hypothetical protein